MLTRTPSTLTLVTTLRCTASCKECCFECNPSRKQRMSLDEMKRYCQEAIQSFPSIKLIVFTGGECFLLGKDLYEMVSYVHSYGLKSRIISNAFWANSYDAAYNCLKKLKDCGLTEINYSTGDDHQEYIPIQNIKNAVNASLNLEIITCVNIETRNDRNFGVADFISDDDIKKQLSINRGQFRVIAGMWMPFTEEALKQLPHKDKGTYTIQCGRCENLFESVNIMPDGKMIACCGLASKYMKYLHLGSMCSGKVKLLYDKQFNDFLKLWLFVDGPYKILEFIERKKTEVPELKYDSHMCFYCACLFSNPDYMHIAQNYYKEKYDNVMMKYFLIHKNN